MKELIGFLRNKELISVNNSRQHGIMAPLDEDCLQRLSTYNIEINHLNSHLLIGDIGQLYDYVQDIPEIAWDIVELEEKPLSVVYPTGKNIPHTIYKDQNTIAIMLVKEPVLQKQLYNYGKGVLFIKSITPQKYELILPTINYQLNLLNHKTFDLFDSKTISLAMNGEIRFL